MKKGSVTIFLALVLILVLSFVFSLLEGARVHCLKAKAQMVSELCVQSVFANYHCGIWEDYHLLFLDGTWQEGAFDIESLAQKAMSAAEKNFSPAIGNDGENFWELTGLSATDVEIKNFTLATDAAGSIFCSQVSEQMQLEVAEDVLEELFQIQDETKSMEEEQAKNDETWQKAWDAMAQAQEELQESAEATEEEGIPQQEHIEVENPMEYVKELKSSGILAVVLEEPSQLSTKAVEAGSFLKDRELQRGNGIQPEENALERFWLQYYIQKYFSNYVSQGEKGAKEKVLAYEWEYMLVGKNNDSANLEEVVKRLLGIREIMNFTTIMQDAEKKSLALSIATATVGFTGIMPLVRAVQAGILLSWAYIESVLDVRALLAGKKVPFLKRTDQWASDLTNCRKSIQEKEQSGEDENGWNYSRYLQMLLFLQSEETISYRCMDLIERNEQVQMDAMIQGAEIVLNYQAKPVFWNMNTVVQKGWEHFSFSSDIKFSYGLQ